jgi:serine/threonine protein kinase
MSPEIVSKLYYEGFMADIWAIGVVLFVMLSGDFPFKGFISNFSIYLFILIHCHHYI